MAGGGIRRPLVERFWEKIDRVGPIPEHRRDLGRCWIWTANRDVHRYGVLTEIRPGETRPRPTGQGLVRQCLKAHRVSYELNVGPIPKGMSVCHRCDNPACVNPAHLFLGDQIVNNRDKIRKGRVPRGSELPQARLTGNLVRELRDRHASGESQASLAREVGVNPATLSYALRGKTWTHV